MIKLIVSDFDGTLLPYGESSLSEGVIKRIKSLLDSGVKFAVASGRTYSELKAYFGELAEKIYFIAADGALTLKGNSVIFKKPFSASSLKSFFDFDFYDSVSFYALNTVFTVGNFDGQNFGKRIKPIERFVEINEDIYKISANIKKVLPIISKDYRVHFRENSFAEFVSPFSNKGVALVNLQLHLSVSHFETMAIGDAANDIPMMNHAAFSVSISDKCPDLLKKCKYNFKAVNEAFDLIDEK